MGIQWSGLSRLFIQAVRIRPKTPRRNDPFELSKHRKPVLFPPMSQRVDEEPKQVEELKTPKTEFLHPCPVGDDIHKNVAMAQSGQSGVLPSGCSLDG